MDKKILKHKFEGSMLGTAIGDAFGAPGEGQRKGVPDKMMNGRYTDDTHMMIGMAESLIEERGFDGEHMALIFMRNYYQQPWRGYGPGPPRVFKLIKEGESWDKASRRLYRGGSFGNGGAMRVAPVGLLYYDKKEKLRQVAQGCAKITHSHPLGMEGAVLQAWAVALATRWEEKIDPEKFLRELKQIVQEDVYRDKIEKISRLLSQKDNRRKVVNDLGHGIEAFTSVPTAIYSFLSNIESFKQAVVYAVSLGGDTDTIGAMTGAIAGAYHGVNGIPQKWQNTLENEQRGKDYIVKLAHKLWELKVGLKI